MASHIPLFENDQVIGIDGKPLEPLPVNAWSGLPFEVHPHMRRGEVAHRYNPHALLLVHQRSRGRALIRSGLTTYDLSLEPGHVDVFSTGFHMDHASWDCTPGEVHAIEVDPERTRAFLHDDVTLDPTTRLATRDPVIERLSACMRSEVEAGCPSGKLFAEAMSLALLARLGACYGRHESARPTARKLPAQQLKATIDYIESHMASDLSVTTLARRLDMSAYTFARLFKATTDVSPHAFVLSRRLGRAELLLAGELPLSEIALAVGFASQSHFTETFRRRTGRTPLVARRRG